MSLESIRIDDGLENVSLYETKFLNDITLELMVNKSRLKNSQNKTDNKFNSMKVTDVMITEITHELLFNLNEKITTDKFDNEIMTIFNNYIHDFTQILMQRK